MPIPRDHPARAPGGSTAPGAAWAVGLITLAAALLRVPALDSGLWYDEISTLTRFVRLPVAQIVSTFPSGNNHPLYSVLAHVSTSVFGEHAWSLRLPAVAFGVAAVPALYLLGLELSTRREAVIASILLAVSYHHVWFSQNGRGYSALLFWTLLTTWLLWRALRLEATATYAAYGLVAALGIYTHLSMTFVVASHAILCVWLWLRPGAAGLALPTLRRPAVGFAMASGISLLLYAPVFLKVVNVYSSQPRAYTSLNSPAWAIAETLRGLVRGVGPVGLAMVAPAAVAGFRSYLGQSRLVTATFVLPGILMAAAVTLVGASNAPRYAFFLLGFALLVIARGIVLIAERLDAVVRSGSVAVTTSHLAGALTAIVVISSLAALPRAYQPKQDYEGALRFVESQARGPESIFTVGRTQRPYAQYYGRAWGRLEDADDMQALVERDGDSWVLYSLARYLAPDLRAAIDRHCQPVRTFGGSLSGGDVTVCRVRGRRTERQRRMPEPP